MAFSSGDVLTAAALNTFDPSTKITNAAGSNSAPSYTFNGDTDTGMYRSAADTIAFTTGGTQRATITSSGITADLVGSQSGGSIAATTLTASGDANFDSGTLFVDVSENKVGIGTTSPGLALHVNSGATNSTSVFESTDHTAIIGVKDNTTSGNAYVGVAAVGDDLRLRAGNDTMVTIKDDGDVGIGTTSPSAELELQGSSTVEFRIVSDDASDTALYFGDTTDKVRAGFLYDISENAMLFRGYNNSTRLTITSGGVVQWSVSSGIGGPLTATSSTSGYRYVLRNQTFGTLFEFSSDRDRKDQITNVTTADSAKWIDALQPVTYIERWLGEGDEPADSKQWREADMQVGFIADDVLASSDASHFAQAIDNGAGGLDPSGWKWETVIAAAVAEIKSLRTRVATLEGA